MTTANYAILAGTEYESRSAASTAPGMVTRHRRSSDMSSIRIPLNSRKYPGLYALIDEADFELVSQYQWHPKPQPGGLVYAAMGKDSVRMHRLLMTPPAGFVVDHVNGNGLDNRRENLRICTISQNTRHSRGVQPNNTSGFIGVSWHQRAAKWCAQICYRREKIYLGVFDSAIDAAIARDAAAVRLHGEFAKLNFPDLEGM